MYTLAPFVILFIVILFIVILFGALTFLPLFNNPPDVDENK